MKRPLPRPVGVALGLSGLLAGLLAWCALPAAVADLIALPYAGAVSLAKAGLPVRPGVLAAAARANIDAARWAERNRHLSDAAVALLGAGDAEGARNVLTEALAARPNGSHNWLRLASARRFADPAGARAAWTMAVATAPFDPQALRPTLAIGFSLLPTRDAGFASRLALRVRIAARLDPLGLATAARMRGVESFVYASLFGDPDLSWRFSTAMAAVSRPTFTMPAMP